MVHYHFKLKLQDVHAVDNEQGDQFRSQLAGRQSKAGSKIQNRALESDMPALFIYDEQQASLDSEVPGSAKSFIGELRSLEALQMVATE